MYSTALLPKRQITQFHFMIFVISILVIYHAYFFIESYLICTVLKPFDVISVLSQCFFSVPYITGPLCLRELLPISFLYLGISNCKGFLSLPDIFVNFSEITRRQLS